MPLVAVYDPDPIASLRKRRVSTDSHDSVTSHGHGEPRAGQDVRRQPSSKLAQDPAPHAEKRKVRGPGEGQKIKKKHKKSHKHARHGHHNCHKHKHRRHVSCSAEAAAKSKHEAAAGAKHVQLYQELDPEEADTSEQEASQEEETDHHNTSDEEEVKEFKQLL